jgi:hypothetical protein
MKVNVNHPSFISFIENVTNNILSNISIQDYFSLNLDKNEESENYEFAAILNDISKNFEKVNEVTNTKKRITRKIKTDTSSNG